MVLTISDHLDWVSNTQHQTILQNKFNAYLAFVESGEVLQQYPEAKERPVVLNVVFRHSPRRRRKFIPRASKTSHQICRLQIAL